MTVGASALCTISTLVLTFGNLWPATHDASGAEDIVIYMRKKIDSSTLIVFGAEYCPFCHRVEAALMDARLEHTSHALNAAERSVLRKMTGQRTIPYVFVRGRFIGGCNDGPEAWMGTLPLIQSGELQKMLRPQQPPQRQTSHDEMRPQGMARSHAVAVVGSGVAALTAATYLARADRAPLVLMGDAAESGGQLMLTSAVDNFPGFPDGISGPELMRRMEQQAKTAGANLTHERVVSIERQSAGRGLFVLRTSRNTSVSARAVVVATGASARWLDLDGEKRLRGRYLHTCARCDGPLYSGANVLVVGGGDSAAEAALLLSRHAASVTLVHRRATFRMGARQLAAVRNTSRIRVRAPAEVRRWVVREGDGASSSKLTAVELYEPRPSGEPDGVMARTSTLEVSGAFIAIGHEPASAFLPPGVMRDEQGYVRLPAARSSMSSVDGIFACGDVADPRYRQAVTAAGAGAQAALDADEWLEFGVLRET